MPAGFPVAFKRYRPPPNVGRGLCRKCGKPVIEFLTLVPGARICFVPSRNVEDIRALPAPAAHVFYERRVADIDDALPKVSGYWRSELAIIRSLLEGMLGPG